VCVYIIRACRRANTGREQCENTSYTTIIITRLCYTTTTRYTTGNDIMSDVKSTVGTLYVARTFIFVRE